MGYRFSSQAEAFYSKLKKADLFHNVGGPLKGTYVRPKNWSEAFENYMSNSYDNSLTDAANAIATQLPDEIYNRWNTISKPSKARFIPLVDEKLKEALEAGRIPKKLFDHKHYGIHWDILHYVVECEYAEYLEPGILTEKVDLYLRGFFPCGWEGDFPVGCLIVF